MDPLSITASILTVLGVGGQAIKAVKKVVSLKGAPDVVLRLHNELSDLHLLTVSIQDVFQTVQTSGIPLHTNTRRSATNSLKLVNEKLVELEELHDRLMATSQPGTSSTPNVNRSAWFAEQTHLKRLQKDLRGARLKLTSVLGTLSSSSLAYLSTEMGSLQTRLEEMHTELKNTGTTSTQAFIRQEDTIMDVQRKIEGLQATHQQSVATQRQRSRERQKVLLTSDTQFLAIQQRIEIKLDALQAAAAVRTAQDLITAPRLPTSTIATSSTHFIMVSASLVRQKCSTGCICVCHRKYTTRSPQFLSRFFGTLFLGYAGLPIMTPSCDSKACTQRTTPAVVVAYYFPLWLLARTVSLAVKLSYHEGPQFCLKVARVIDEGSRIFGLAQMGQNENLRQLLRHRTFSPSDIGHRTGLTPLMHAISWCRADVCETLLREGADPCQEHPTRGNAYDLALEIILQKKGDTTSHERLRNLFHNDDAIEKLGLTLLHQTILGLNGLDNQELLRSSSNAMIDEPDLQGRTALSWAACRGDLSAISLLIGAGADVNKSDIRGNRPLDRALASRNEACISLLLDLESIESKYKSVSGLTALHDCCVHGSLVTVLERLIDNGVDIEQPCYDGVTCLYFAAQYGHNHLIQSLMSHGANIDATTLNRETPLSVAIEMQNNQGLELLLAHKANYRQLIHTDETLLHHAAIHGDMECLRTLSSFGLDGIDIHARTTGFGSYHNNEKIKGRTALEIAMEREDVTLEWRETFKQLVHKIEFPQGGDDAGGRQEGLEVFEDAVEHQN